MRRNCFQSHWMILIYRITSDQCFVLVYISPISLVSASGPLSSAASSRLSSDPGPAPAPVSRRAGAAHLVSWENWGTNRNTTTYIIPGCFSGCCETLRVQRTGSGRPRANNDLEQGAMQIFLFVSRHDLQDFCVHGIACIEHHGTAHQSPVSSKRNPHEWSNLNHGFSGLWQHSWGKKGILCTFIQHWM